VKKCLNNRENKNAQRLAGRLCFSLSEPDQAQFNANQD